MGTRLSKPTTLTTNIDKNVQADCIHSGEGDRIKIKPGLQL